jgi:AcrR family transcriptional regulator
MNHIMNKKKSYQSHLRQEQMKRTREQILEGLIKTMANGIVELSIPAVAHEARVSIPTVYRYFRTKRELIEALGGYVVEKIGINAVQLPRSPEELASAVREMFVRSEGLDEVLRAASISELGKEFRKDTLPARMEIIENALAPVAARFNETDWIRLRNIVLVLSSSAMIRAFIDYLDLSGEEAADTVTWAILILARANTKANETTQQQ